MLIINIRFTTVSSCLVGNQTESFSVGGVDQSTTIDENGRPIIHGSTFKGALRNILREESLMKNTENYVKSLIEKVLEKYEGIGKTDKINKMIKSLKEKAYNPKAEYIFGMEGVNNMPRLFCSDFRVLECEDKRNDDYFLIETKNNLEEKNGDLISNPRTYKVIKPGVVFEGIIRFYNPFFEDSDEELEKVKCELENAIRKFDTGLYRIGNSKSRGYGQIRVDFGDGIGAGECDDKI
ncbi:MAG: RAMP superfamily CRISPR-associated protein [Peptoanaerobacter stomatis]|uniref:RAMP superfamily CRISPR-associated protein n=1 Tax=Peptoanaerobacter stomatis TaxID=796937 RepID=UPI003FA06CD3